MSDRRHQPELRLSDAERDAVLGRLTEAYREGRLDRDELDERMSAVLASKKHGDLVPLLMDLPEPVEPTEPTEQPEHAGADEDRSSALRPFLMISSIMFITMAFPALVLGYPAAIAGWLFLMGFWSIPVVATEIIRRRRPAHGLPPGPHHPRSPRIRP